MEQKIKLSGLDCASCALAIESALDQIAGVTDSEVDDRESILKVTYDESRVTVAAILNAVRDAGFDAEPI
ncbi:MAG: heavy-metal-associated domain-containing protein [Candidatus Kerfeldbacteria bacterium]|nr:heavy-metal-associated domain-containing protein [Candidatus Kerfeldbacteria bacterium]